MPFVIDEFEIPSIISDETFYLNVLVEVIPAVSHSTARRLDARLYVDDVLVPIKSYNYTESENAIAGTLSVVLADPQNDRDKIIRDAEFRFQEGEYLSGSWVWTTRLDTARLSQSNYTLANNNITPADEFTLVVTPLLQARLETTELTTTVRFDPLKVTVREEDFAHSSPVAVTITEVTGLSVYTELAYVCGAIGFAGFQTNIPDFPLRRVDYPAGTPLWNQIAGIIGMFEPTLDIDTDDNLIIRDGSAEWQPDTEAARTLTVDHIEQAGISTDIERHKGIFLTYQEQTLGWDYSQIEIVHNDRTLGDGKFVNQQTHLQKFYRNSFPNTPINTLRRIEEKRVTASATTLAYSHEILNYDLYTQNLLSDRIKNVYGRVQVPASYVGGVGNDYATAYTLIRTETESFDYYAHPYKADSVYLAYREQETEGIITTDADNQQLGADFKQPLLTAQRSGNLVNGQTVAWGTTGFEWEEQIPLPNGQVLIRNSQTDNLNGDGEALLPPDYSAQRVGDIDIPIIKYQQNQLFVTTGADATAKAVISLNGGEAPLSVLTPLCERLNRRQNYPANVQMSMPGFQADIKKGRILNPKIDGREEVSVGIFKVTGFSTTGSEGEFRTTITARQIG